MTTMPSSPSSWIASRYSSSGGWNPSGMLGSLPPGVSHPGRRLGPMARLMLIDGNSLTYRAFFALPTDMATASGQVTNAVFGFTSMLINLIKDHHPDHIAVAFDLPQPTFRHEFVEGYKAGRVETPDILRQQIGLVRQVVDALHIPVLEAAGVEADDILATL